MLSYLILVVSLMSAVSGYRSNGGSTPVNDVQLLTRASNTFSQNLYQQIALTEPNVCYSPFSIHLAMTMAYLGALGTTASEMATALGLSDFNDANAPHTAYRNLIECILASSNSDVQIYIANAIFVNPNRPIKSQYVSRVVQDYKAQVSNFDLAAPGGPEEAVNDFIENNTRGLIPNVLQPGSITSDTVMLLVNTMFFNGTWLTPFLKDNTQDKDFYTLTGGTIQVPMMYDQRTINLKRNIYGADVAEIPFQNDQYSLYIALPRARNGIVKLEEKLKTPGRIDQLFEGLVQVRVNLSIPAIKIESSFGLNVPLQNLGIKAAFDPNLANFKNISDENVYISSVIHKAVLDINELGTTAAAATIVIISTTSVQSPPEVAFNANHPFLIFLRDNKQKLILFQAKYSGV